MLDGNSFIQTANLFLNVNFFRGQDALWRIFPSLQDSLVAHPEVAWAFCENTGLLTENVACSLKVELLRSLVPLRPGQNQSILNSKSWQVLCRVSFEEWRQISPRSPHYGCPGTVTDGKCVIESELAQIDQKMVGWLLGGRGKTVQQIEANSLRFWSHTEFERVKTMALLTFSCRRKVEQKSTLQLSQGEMFFFEDNSRVSRATFANSGACPKEALHEIKAHELTSQQESFWFAVPPHLISRRCCFYFLNSSHKYVFLVWLVMSQGPVNKGCGLQHSYLAPNE